MNTILARKVAICAASTLITLGLITWLAISSKKDEEFKPKEIEQIETKTSPDSEILEPVVGDNQPENVSSAIETVLPEDSTEQSEAEKKVTPGDLSSDSLWSQIISTDYLNMFVTFLDEVSMGYIPVRSLGNYRSEIEFTAVERDGDWYISEETEKRYEGFVNMFCSLDAEKTGKLYNSLKPRLQKIIIDMGYPDKTPDAMVGTAICVLRDTPLYESNPPMTKVTENIYTWQYPEIETLAPVQKLMMRLGQGNLMKIKTHAEDLAAAMNIE